MDFYEEDEEYFLSEKDDDGLIKKAQEIAEWSYRYNQIENFFVREFRDLIDHGGKNVTLVMNNGNKINGILTLVSYQYLQLNSSLRFPFDDICAIFLRNDKSE